MSRENRLESAPRALPARSARARHAIALAALACSLATPTAFAQLDAGSAAPPEPARIVRITAAPVALKAGSRAEAVIELAIESPWHINANPPSPDYMIATRLLAPAAFGVTPGRPVYPPAHDLKVEFDDKPLAVYDHAATIRLPLAAGADAVNGRHAIKGTLRFQACNDQVCLAPASVPFELAVTVSGGLEPGAAGSHAAAGGAPPGSEGTPPGSVEGGAPARAESARGAGVAPPGGGTPLRPVGGAGLASNPVADVIARGGVVAFATLFLIGLALNLTPCVYPMIGVTVSIFGARSAAPALRVFGSALLYVLGMTVMYSSLGVAAAFTGGLFGSFLQNAVVQAAIGVLLILMSLSMFGAYELQPPAWLLTRLGGSGTTNAIGVFLSGLVVGVFAAPCVGPPVVALLAIVGAKADPWFGFTSFFTLALGLGAPYLVLGTFSGALQKLPRSGDWMVWVKKVFGVILAAVGLFYAGVAFAPELAPWVAPAALLAGGLYLGFIDKSAANRRGFVALKRATGVAAIAAGVWMVASAPRQALPFRPYDPAAVKQALASGQTVILDFSAGWCLPCHELERSTFSDARVMAAAQRFAAFQVDLTRSDSPEAQARMREFRIQGVPTVVFLAPNGQEVEAARFSGFLPAEQFLERMKLAADHGREG